MLGACLRHPVTRAIRDDALRLDPPDWTAGHAALSRLATLLSSTLKRVIDDARLPFEPAPNWGCIPLEPLNRAAQRALQEIGRILGLL